MKYELNSSRSLLKPFWGENDKTLKLENVKILKSTSINSKPFHGLTKETPKNVVQREIRRVTFQLKLSKSKVLDILKDKLDIEGIELQNLYFFALKRNVKIKKKRR